MKRPNNYLTPKSEADLLKVVEPLASYIAAVGRPRDALIAALILLLDNLQQINVAADRQIAALSEAPFD